MHWIERNIKWILVVAGIFTLGMLYAAFAPFAALRTLFGESLDGPVANMVVRNWGALIALIGAMILYAAYRPVVRRFVLAVTGLSKVVFIALVIGGGNQFLGHPIAIAAIIDILIVMLFAGYLWTTRRAAARRT